MNDLKKKLEYYLIDNASELRMRMPFLNIMDFLYNPMKQELSVWQTRQCFAYLKHFAAMRIISAINLVQSYNYHIAFYEENDFFDESIHEDIDEIDWIDIDYLYHYRLNEKHRITTNLKSIIEINFLEELLSYGFLDLYKSWVQQSSLLETSHFVLSSSLSLECEPFASLKTISYMLKHDFGKHVGIDFRELRAQKAQAEKAELDAELKALMGLV